MDSNILVTVVLSLLAILVVFLVIRELVCWYWKINRIVVLLEKIEKNTRIIQLDPEPEEDV